MNWMRDRLIELISQKQNWGQAYETGKNNAFIRNISNSELADHLLANGVIAMPFKMLDEVYFLAQSNLTKRTTVKSGQIKKIIFTEQGVDLLVYGWSSVLPLGKRVFLTEAQALMAADRLRGGGDAE